MVKMDDVRYSKMDLMTSKGSHILFHWEPLPQLKCYHAKLLSGGVFSKFCQGCIFNMVAVLLSFTHAHIVSKLYHVLSSVKKIF